MAYLLGYLAEKERFVVESIADGRKAVERIDRGDAVDLVLLDVMLPYTDGFELLETPARTRGLEAACRSSSSLRARASTTPCGRSASAPTTT